MPQNQNPTTKGSRVLWNSLVGTSTEYLSMVAFRVQRAVAVISPFPETAALIAAVGGLSYE